MKKILLLIPSFSLFLQERGKAQCQAAFTYTINQSTVYITNVSTYSMSVASFEWTVGNNFWTYLENPAPLNLFYNGTYTVCLTIKDSLQPSSCTDTYCAVINITNAPNPPCDSLFNYWVDTVAPYTVNFIPSNSGYTTQWLWDFGDGNNAAVSSPYTSHTYSAMGTYSVCLSGINTIGDTCTSCQIVNSTPCTFLLNTAFTHTSNNPVSFTNNSSGSQFPGYFWDFGDGYYSFQQNPTHSYAYNGTYTVCLTYADSSTYYCSKTVCSTVTITNAANHICNSIFAYFSDSANAGNNSVIYYDQSTSGIVSRLWSFPGGTPSSGTSAWEVVTYPGPGAYSASITVTNASGTSCSYSNAVNVGNNCTYTHAFFSLSPTQNPQVWMVKDSSFGAPPLSYVWSWGDGSPNSTIPNPTHTYTVAGWYNICVTITDANGCGSSYCLFDSLYKFQANGSMITVIVTSAGSGISEANADPGFSIYPNPSNGKLIFENNRAKGEMEVHSMVGEKIFATPVEKGTSYIDISSAAPSIYLVMLNTSEGSSVRKIVVQK